MDASMMNIGLPIESITKVETFQIAEWIMSELLGQRNKLVLETRSLLIITGTVFARHVTRIFIFLIWIHQLWKFVLIATKDVIVGKVAKNASNSFVYFVMTISKLMLKLLMFSLP
jgi:hypothetical protein